MISNGTKMTEIANPGPLAATCSNEKCRKRVPVHQTCFLDTMKDRIYCHQCGLCLRYARKMALRRGESIETAEV